MKKAIYTLFAIALAACTAENLPEKPTTRETPETQEPTTETVSINVRLAEPATKAIINDSGSRAASFSWENGDEIGVVVGNKYYCFTLEGKPAKTPAPSRPNSLAAAPSKTEPRLPIPILPTTTTKAVTLSA
jgi:hypothetical protein